MSQKTKMNNVNVNDNENQNEKIKNEEISKSSFNDNINKGKQNNFIAGNFEKNINSNKQSSDKEKKIEQKDANESSNFGQNKMKKIEPKDTNQVDNPFCPDYPKENNNINDYTINRGEKKENDNTINNSQSNSKKNDKNIENNDNQKSENKSNKKDNNQNLNISETNKNNNNPIEKNIILNNQNNSERINENKDGNMKNPNYYQQNNEHLVINNNQDVLNGENNHQRNDAYNNAIYINNNYKNNNNTNIKNNDSNYIRSNNNNNNNDYYSNQNKNNDYYSNQNNNNDYFSNQNKNNDYYSNQNKNNDYFSNQNKNNDYYSNQNKNNDYFSNQNNNNYINNLHENNVDKFPLNKYKEVSKTGLENLYDISYLNAVLQSLGQIKDFANYFLREDIQKKIESNVKYKPLAFVTERLFRHLYPYPSKPQAEKYKLKSYMRVLKSLSLFYNNMKRKNVNDVLIFLLDRLHNELSSNNTSIISKTVTFSLQNEIKCLNCGNSSNRTISFNAFDLDISKTYKCYQKNINIYDCLNFWKSNNCPKLYCYKCRNFTQRNKASIIESAPKIFIFLLQRGISFDQYNKYILIPFIVDEKINLSNYIMGGTQNYELTGIVAILLNEQKYISYCKSPIDQLWYFYNDTEVLCISLKEIFSLMNNQKVIPCILYYTKN